MSERVINTGGTPLNWPRHVPSAISQSHEFSEGSSAKARDRTRYEKRESAPNLVCALGHLVTTPSAPVLTVFTSRTQAARDRPQDHLLLTAARSGGRP